MSHPTDQQNKDRTMAKKQSTGESPVANELKTLKRNEPSKKPRKAHEHDWAYEHSIYSLGDQGVGIAVHRQCRVCAVHELCKTQTPKWTRNVEGFDLPNLR